MQTPVIRSYDKMIFFAMFCLIIFGTIMIYSSTGVVVLTPEKKSITEFYYVKRHLITMIIGTIAFLMAYRLKATNLEKIAVPLLIFSGILLVWSLSLVSVSRPEERGDGSGLAL